MVAATLGHRLPRMVDNDDRKRHLMSQLTAGRVGENGDGSCFGSLLGELRAVMMRTRQCDVQVAWTYQPGVDGDATDKRIAYRGADPRAVRPNRSGVWCVAESRPPVEQ